jgi:uncharacterized protein YndB with AHSA1/START domain
VLRIARRIEAPAARVWTLLVETRHWTKWGPSVLAVDAPERIGPGARGRVRTPLGWAPFEVTGYEEGRAWRWSVAGVPATAHCVEPLGPAACRVSFEVPLWAAPYALVCRVALGRIQRIVGGSIAP